MPSRYRPIVHIIVAVLAFAFSVVAGTAAAQTSKSAAPNDSIQVYLSKGGMALKATDYPRAIQNLQAVLRLDSTNVTALRNVGAAFAALGDYRQAKVYLEKAYAQNPNDPEVLNNLGVIASQNDDPAAAIKYFEGAVAADSNSALYLNSLGNEHLRIGRVQKAYPLLERAHKLAPKNPVPSFSLGKCFSVDRKYDSAAYYYEQAIAAGDSSAGLYYFLGIAKRQLGDMDGAEKNYKLAIERNPKYKECIQALGLLYAQKGKFVTAASYFEKAVALDSVFYPAWVSLGASLALTYQKARADSILQKLAKVDTSYASQMLRLIAIEVSKQSPPPTDSVSNPTKK
jgi:tetratricopeptide (TPR) repeat protein